MNAVQYDFESSTARRQLSWNVYRCKYGAAIPSSKYSTSILTFLTQNDLKPFSQTCNFQDFALKTKQLNKLS